jgi:hypothetical protein
LQHFGHGGRCGDCAALNHREVEVCRIPVVGDVDEPEGSSAFEDQPSTVRGLRQVQLGDDVAEDVVTFGNRRIDTVLVSPPRDRVSGQRG